MGEAGEASLSSSRIESWNNLDRLWAMSRWVPGPRVIRTGEYWLGV